MSYSYLDTSIEYLKGVGPKRAEILKKELQVYKFGDMLNIFPFRYVDRSKFYKVRDIESDSLYIQLKGKIGNMQQVGFGKNIRMTAYLEDDSGKIELVWFKGIKWLKDRFKPDVEYIIFGKPNYFKGNLSIPHPEIEAVSEEKKEIISNLQPFYYSTEKLKSKGLDSKGISKLIKTFLAGAKGMIPETLPEEIIRKAGLIPREEAIINIHFPQNQKLLEQAEYRLKFEELFFIQLKLLKEKLIRTEKFNGHKFSVVGKYFNDFFYNNLSFKLTEAQKKVVKEIRADLGSGKQMNRLLQGDVGSGKTLVALMTALIALDNGYQACLMAPTEILANQHYETITQMLKGLGINIALLTGSTKAGRRKIIHEELESGQLHILIGTHALIEEKVKYKQLGLVIIDEQHRFGVAQRAKLWEKNINPPHILIMTATPIPRTLAMTLYGDLDISVIDEMPSGRKPIKTYHLTDSSRLKVFGFMKEQIKKGQQIYVVYPLIKESETLDLKDLMDGYESIVRNFPLPDYAVSIVHGQMKSADKDYEMNRFVKGETQVMVATTVIEVGIDIPNASVMVIESAERFGLSQLHQLRGRVGRGVEQSYCILMTKDNLSSDAKKRVETMVRTTDGFEIAEVDLKLRGPGDLQGTQQSGILDLKLADLARDEKILLYSRNFAAEILKKDPLLEKEENRILNKYIMNINKNNINWSKIS